MAALLTTTSEIKLPSRDLPQWMGRQQDAPQAIWRRFDWLHWVGEMSLLQPPFEESMAQIEIVLSFLRSKQILILQPQAIRDYLFRYGDLTLILAYSCDRAYQRFAPHAQMTLDLYQDPEINDSYLTLYVRQENYDGNLMKEIKAFRKGYETLLIGRSGWLHVTTDFCPPLQANK